MPCALSDRQLALAVCMRWYFTRSKTDERLRASRSEAKPSKPLAQSATDLTVADALNAQYSEASMRIVSTMHHLTMSFMLVHGVLDQAPVPDRAPVTGAVAS